MAKSSTDPSLDTGEGLRGLFLKKTRAIIFLLCKEGLRSQDFSGLHPFERHTLQPLRLHTTAASYLATEGNCNTGTARRRRGSLHNTHRQKPQNTYVNKKRGAKNGWILTESGVAQSSQASSAASRDGGQRHPSVSCVLQLAAYSYNTDFHDGLGKACGKFPLPTQRLRVCWHWW